MLALNDQDAAAAAAIRAHHVELEEGIRTRVRDLTDVVRAGDPHESAAGALLGFLDGELLPHAAAEEGALYPAGNRGPTAALVAAMIDEHRAIVGHVDRLRGARDGIDAVSAAAAVLALFEAHLRKENERLIPALVDDPEVDLHALLEGMHELVG